MPESPACRSQVRDDGETMEVRFDCVFEGKRIFQVVHSQSDAALFTGTAAQCKRFLEIHHEKADRASGVRRPGTSDLSTEG